MPTTVNVAGRGTITFDDNVSDEEIQQIVQKEFPVSGEDVVRSIAEDPSYAQRMSRDDFMEMRRYKEDKPVDFLAKLAEAFGGIGELVSNAFTTAPKFDPQAGPIEKGASLVANIGQGAMVAAGDFGNMFISVLEGYSNDNNSYTRYRLANDLKDTQENRAEYDRIIDSDFESFKGLQTWQQSRKDILGQASMPAMAETISLVAQPPLPGAALLQVAGVGERIGMMGARAAQMGGKGIQAVGEAASAAAKVPQQVAGAAARALTGSEQVAGIVEKAVATGSTGLAAGQLGGFTIPGLSTAATTIAGAKAVGKGLEVAGEVTQKLAEHAGKKAGRLGVFESLANDLSASTAARAIGRVGSVAGADIVAPYVSAAIQGAAEGAIIGGTIGFITDGEEGAAGGMGAGLALGGAGGLAGRGYAQASGMIRQNKIVNDALRGIASLEPESRANASRLFDQFIKDGNQEAVAEMVDAKNWLSSDVYFSFINNEQAKAMPAASGTSFEGITVFPSAVTGGKPAIYINVDTVKPGTGFHESFHGAMRTALGETFGKKFTEVIDQTFTPEEKVQFAEDYIKRGGTEEGKQKLRDYLAEKQNLPEEIGAEYFREFLQRRENRDLLLRGQRTTDGSLIAATKGAIDYTLSKLGIDYDATGTGYKGMDALASELIKARTDINKSIAQNGKPLAPVTLDKMATPKLADWAKEHGQSDVLLKDPTTGDVIGVKTEEQVNIGRDAANARAAEEIANVPRGTNAPNDAELAIYQKYFPLEQFLKLTFASEAIKSGNVLNGDYFPATAKKGETSVYASRGMTNLDFVPYKIRTTKKNVVVVDYVDLTQLKARFDDIMSRSKILDQWGGDKDAAWQDVMAYTKNLSLGEGVAKPSAELFGPIKRDIINKIYGFVPTKAQISEGAIKNISSLGTNIAAESGTGKSQIGKPAYEGSRDTRVVSTMRLDRLGRIADTGRQFSFNENGTYGLSQVNFKPAENLGSAKVNNSDEGFRIIAKGNKHSLYAPTGERIGIYDTQAGAEKKANQINFKNANSAEGSRFMPENKIAAALPRRNMASSKDVSYDDQGNIKFRNKEPKDWTPEDFAEYGKGFGVENLGPLSDVKEISQGVAGNTARVPGGLDGKFTYYDLLWLKSHPVDVKSLPETTHGQLTAKLARTMEPAPGDKVSSFNAIVFGMLSPNAPLLPNEMGQARLRFGSMDEIKKFADLYPDNPTKENLVKLNQQLKQQLGFIAAGKGGLGIPITADLSNIVNAARLFSKNPDFFVKQPNESWANFVDKLTTQVSGFGTKTGSFGSVWQDPLNASISAMDRHMSRIFGQELLGDPQLRQRFEGIIVDRFNKLLSDSKKVSSSFAKKISNASSDKTKTDLLKERNKELAKLPDPTATKAKSLDDVLGQAEVYGADRVREFVNEAVFAAMGSRKAKLITAKGEISANAPEHIRDVKWVETPADFQVMSDAYRSALEINERRANDLGIAVFPAQWTLWDRIRQRVEPHEAMFPGLEKLPALNDKQLAEAYASNKAAGYMSTPKAGKQWKRKDVGSPSQLAYFMPDAPDTPAFKKWFGESKVVDGDGKPLVVYHGGSATNEFRPISFWTVSRPVADSYAAGGRSVGGNGGKVTEAFLSLQNLLDLSEVSERTPWENIRPLLSDAGVPNRLLDELSFAEEQRPGIPGIFDGNWATHEKEIVASLKEAGYDGVRITEDDLPGFIVFDPTQIKSATGNSGAFDTTNPDIRFMPEVKFSAPEKLPNGQAWSTNMNYRVIQKTGGKYRVYAPVGAMIGVTETLEQARRLIEKKSPAT
jgi:hypothetical protein